MQWMQISLLVGSLVLMYHNSLLAHMRNISHPLHMNSDALQQIWPLLRYYKPGLFNEDYIADYYLSCFLPSGYRLFYRVGAIFWDPRVLSEVLSYLLLGVLLAALAMSAYKLGGKSAAWATLAFALSTGQFMGGVTGGLPRSFGYPLMACAAAALVYGRPVLLAALVVLGAGFYPVVSVMTGLALAAYVLLVSRDDRGRAEKWTLRKRLLVVVATALLASIVVLPHALGSRRYGSMIGPAHTDTFPEAGQGGRYSDRHLFGGHEFLTASWGMLDDTIKGAGDPWSDVLRRLIPLDSRALVLWALGITLVGSAVLTWHDPGARRLLILLAAAATGHWAASIAAPFLYLPARYVTYSIPILFVILLPASITGLAKLLGGFGQNSWARPTIVLVVCGIMLMARGGRGPETEGIYFYSNRYWPVLQELKKLPRDAMIAGLPGDIMNLVPYLSERRALVTYKTHQAFHSKYVLEMRRRVIAVFDAYYATDEKPLIRLRDDFGVTHLVVDRGHFAGIRLKYFEPFSGWFAHLQAQVKPEELEIFRQIDSAAVYNAFYYVVLDLRRLRQTSGRSFQD